MSPPITGLRLPARRSNKLPISVVGGWECSPFPVSGIFFTSEQHMMTMAGDRTIRLSHDANRKPGIFHSHASASPEPNYLYFHSGVLEIARSILSLEKTSLAKEMNEGEGEKHGTTGTKPSHSQCGRK